MQALSRNVDEEQRHEDSGVTVLVLRRHMSSTMKGFLFAGIIVVLTVAAVGEGNHAAPFWNEDPIFHLTRFLSVLVLWNPKRPLVKMWAVKTVRPLLAQCTL